MVYMFKASQRFFHSGRPHYLPTCFVLCTFEACCFAAQSLPSLFVDHLIFE